MGPNCVHRLALKGEGWHSLPLKGALARATFAIGRRGVDRPGIHALPCKPIFMRISKHARGPWGICWLPGHWPEHWNPGFAELTYTLCRQRARAGTGPFFFPGCGTGRQ